MGKTPFIWLGSRRSRKYPVGNKGKLLDIAASRGLPVPNGAILLHELYQLLLDEQVIVQERNQIICSDPHWLYETIFDQGRLPRLDKPVAVRSAFSAEDGQGESLAGYFSSRLHVDMRDPLALSDALCAVWSSALKHQGQFRRDVLVMEMVAAQAAGVAFSEAAFQDDLINFSRGTADRLVSGQEPGEALVVARLAQWERPSPELPPFARRLQRLLRGVRHSFGPGNWDIEWADDGQICWLVQVRPITRPPRRNEAFTFANIREIMPDPPSPFMTGIVAACAPALFAYYRQFDRRLPTNRPIIEVFAGRPLFNISLLTDMMRAWGLPSNLVTNSIGGTADREAGFHLGRFLRSSIPLLRQGFAQVTAVSHARRATPPMLARAAQPGDSFAACADTLIWLFGRLVSEMFNLTAALSLPLLLLRRTGTLAEHNANNRSVSTEMVTDLEPLRRLVAGQPELQAAVAQGTAPDDPDFQKIWQAYLNKHGHRGVYESDIARSRYREAPAGLLQSLSHPGLPPPEPPRRSWRGWLTWPVWWHCRRVLRAREEWRYQAMIAYDDIRNKLLELAETAVARGQLPRRDDLWLLHLDEARALDAGRTYDAPFFTQRRQEMAILAEYDLPDLLYRFDDLEAFRTGSAPVAARNGRLRGVSLTHGTAAGKAWVLREPASALPAGYTPEKTILVARSVDAGWIPTFSLVSGAVIEIGGDLSHGSIILREIGLPAITNVSQATRQISPGQELRLHAGAGIVEMAEAP